MPGLKALFGNRVLRGPKGPRFHRRDVQNVFETSSRHSRLLKTHFGRSFERAQLYSLRKKLLATQVLKGHAFRRAVRAFSEKA